MPEDSKLRSLGAHDTGPCVWMTAGLLTYKLCDRNFDCERCPLDAAIRRESPWDTSLHPLSLPSVARAFPDDRRYSTGHLWVQMVNQAPAPRFRVGLDAFAAAVIGFCRSVQCELSESRLELGQTLAHVDVGLGVLLLGAPIPGTGVEANSLLRYSPTKMVSEPYGSGWIAHLSSDATTNFDGLLCSRAAREQAMGDLRRLRRRVAQRLLAEEGDGLSMADGGEMLCDLREILGSSGYLMLLKELIH